MSLSVLFYCLRWYVKTHEEGGGGGGGNIAFWVINRAQSFVDVLSKTEHFKVQKYKQFDQLEIIF